VAAAHTMAKQLREAEWHMHETAAARWSFSRAIAFDLHALVPLPGEVLRLGPDDPESLRWMWRNWGTTWTLRRVEKAESRAGTWSVRFFSADWSPWPVFAGVWTRWTSVRKIKEGTADLYGFLTTDSNAEVAALHPQAMPAILTTPEECET
jgi:hypothetical protein